MVASKCSEKGERTEEVLPFWTYHHFNPGSYPSQGILGIFISYCYRKWLVFAIEANTKITARTKSLTNTHIPTLKSAWNVLEAYNFARKIKYDFPLLCFYFQFLLENKVLSMFVVRFVSVKLNTLFWPKHWADFF